jgi:hypothetical protein
MQVPGSVQQTKLTAHPTVSLIGRLMMKTSIGLNHKLKRTIQMSGKAVNMCPNVFRLSTGGNLGCTTSVGYLQSQKPFIAIPGARQLTTMSVYSTVWQAITQLALFLCPGPRDLHTGSAVGTVSQLSSWICHAGSIDC